MGFFVCVNEFYFIFIVILLYASKRFYWSGTQCPSKDRMDNKIVVITGSNAGIGKYTAIELAKRGAHIILACRNRQRAEEAKKEIQTKSNNNQIDIEIVDTSSLQSVRECALRLRERVPRIDVLINNAGVLTKSHEKSIDGYEIHLATNHLGHFLLTNLLLDLLKKAPSARIINVSALAHKFFNCHMHWDDINLENTPCSAFYAYARSKLANIMFTNELAKRLKGTNITTNSLHPGVIKTELGRDFGGRYQNILNLFIQLLTPILWFFFKDLEQGAQTTTYLASDLHLDNVTGKYFSDCTEVQPSKTALNEQDNRRLWLLSEQMTKLNESIYFIMISLLIICSLSFLPNIIYSSIPFAINPGCDLPQCKEINHIALYYAKQSFGDNIVHLIYSSSDELTITVFELPIGYSPIFNYTELFAKNYSGAIHFDGPKPTDSFTLVLRRLIQFNDKDDNGTMSKYDTTTNSYLLSDLKTNNITFQSSTTDQPTFQLPLPLINGSLSIDIVYPGEKMRDTKFPKLQTASKSFFLNIALQATGFSLPNTRFAFEIFLMLPSNTGSKIFSSRFIDDQYTPGIFNVWQMRTPDSLYPSSMLWKPVVYQSEDRTIEQNTLMKVYGIKNNITLDPIIDQGIFYSILRRPYVSAFNISLGQANDGFFAKTNYTFIQFTAGLDLLEPDSTQQFVTVALIVSLALPAVVAVIALIVILRRKFSQQSPSSYGAIED